MPLLLLESKCLCCFMYVSILLHSRFFGRISFHVAKVVFEKILKSGEVLKIKKDWLNGNLRAGNARDLFFSLDGITYGPVSDTRTVIKKFKIDPDYIFDTLKINHLKDSFMNKSLSLKKSL